MSDSASTTATSPATTTAIRDFATDSLTGAIQDVDAEVSEGDDNAGHKEAASQKVSNAPYNAARQLSCINQDRTVSRPVLPTKIRKGPVGWLELPCKGQLAILTVARLSEPLVQTSLQSYMFFQLKSFDESLPDSTIAAQAGMLTGSFTAAQFLTAMLWGKASDSDWFGRKSVLIIGLFGTMLSCLGFGFAQTFWQAMLFRTIGGALNGNVGVMRTMISEIIQEKRFQSRAFLLLPMCFNIGVIIGPVLGGLLSDPAKSYPSVFGDVAFFLKFPFAAPNIVSAVFLMIGGLAVFFGLDETLGSLQHKEDIGRKCGRKLAELWRHYWTKSTMAHHYVAVDGQDGQEQSQGLLGDEEDLEMSRPSSSGSIVTGSKPDKKMAVQRYKNKLPFRRIFTRNVICTFCAHGILACHIGTFNSLWFVFLSTPVADPAHPNPPGFRQKLPFFFTGGLGMPAQHVGLAMSVLGIIGITLQLAVYPAVNARLGVIRSWRLFLLCFPVAYILVPFLATIPSRTPPPAEKDGILLWIGLFCVLFIQVIGRTFALPATIILLNNCSPHPSVLGTVHGMGQSISSAARTLGPILGGIVYGLGLDHGMIGIAWWGLSCVAVCAIVASLFVMEGNGHEIVLDGDEEAEADYQAAEVAKNGPKDL